MSEDKNNTSNETKKASVSKTKTYIVLGAITLVIAGLGYFVGMGLRSTSNNSGDDGPYKKIYWNQLRELNINTGERTKTLSELNRSQVKIPGFVVPLDDDAAEYSEFLLVPSPQACIHVPPPPSNQMIYVQMQSNKTPKREWGPVWLKGRLLIQDVESEFGKVSYKMLAEDSEPFKY